MVTTSSIIIVVLLAVIAVLGFLYIQSSQNKAGGSPQPTTAITTVTPTTVSSATTTQQATTARQSQISAPYQFTPCTGINASSSINVAYDGLFVATSSDGLHFSRQNRSLASRASVPNLIVDPNGNLRLYYIAFSCPSANISAIGDPVVAVSPDYGKSWMHSHIKVQAPSQAPKCVEPGGNPPPVDPYVVVMKNGTYRLYATCPKPSSSSQTGGIPMSFVFTSKDGFNFSDGQPTYQPAEQIALDPVAIPSASGWYLINGNPQKGNIYATSSDGTTFTEVGQWCPFKYASGTSMCYHMGKALIMLNSTYKYRAYIFGNPSNSTSGFKSMVSNNDLNWTLEQSTKGWILQPTKSALEDPTDFGDPATVRFTNGTYFMVYEAAMAGSWSYINKTQSGGTGSNSGTGGAGGSTTTTISQGGSGCPPNCGPPPIG